MTPARRSGALAAILLSLFLLTSFLVASGATLAFDHAVLTGLREPLHPESPRGPHWLFPLAAHLTVLGAFPARAALGVGGSFLLWRYQQHAGALALILASIAEVPLIEALKLVFARARPDLAYRLVTAGHASFPSGHAAGSMLLYPLAGLLIGRVRNDRSGTVGAIVGVGLALLIGITRIVLGVHWASDVAAGWLLGGGLATIAAMLATPSPPR